MEDYAQVLSDTDLAPTEMDAAIDAMYEQRIDECTASHELFSDGGDYTKTPEFAAEQEYADAAHQAVIDGQAAVQTVGPDVSGATQLGDGGDYTIPVATNWSGTNLGDALSLAMAKRKEALPKSEPLAKGGPGSGPQAGGGGSADKEAVGNAAAGAAKESYDNAAMGSSSSGDDANYQAAQQGLGDTLMGAADTASSVQDLHDAVDAYTASQPASAGASEANDDAHASIENNAEDQGVGTTDPVGDYVAAGSNDPNDIPVSQGGNFTGSDGTGDGPPRFDSNGALVPGTGGLNSDSSNAATLGGAATAGSAPAAGSVTPASAFAAGQQAISSGSQSDAQAAADAHGALNSSSPDPYYASMQSQFQAAANGTGPMPTSMGGSRMVGLWRMENRKMYCATLIGSKPAALCPHRFWH